MPAQGLTIPELLERAAQSCPDKTALQTRLDTGWRKITYRQADKTAKDIASFLADSGFKTHECVGLILENCLEWPLIYFGIVSAGLICVPIDPNLSPQEIENLLCDCQAKALFTSQVLLAKITPRLQGQIKKIITDLSQINPGRGLAPRQISPDDPASLIYTSGTTGKPKGVVLSHSNLCSNCQSIEKLKICYPDDNFLNVLPLFHTYAFTATLLLPVYYAATVTYCLSLKPNDLFDAIREGQASVLVGVPQLFALVHRGIFEKIKKFPAWLRLQLMPVVKIKVRKKFGKAMRLFISGGARLEPQIGRELNYFFEFLEGYGLTETSPVAAFNLPGQAKFGSVGKSIPDVQIKIHEPDANGIGEVLIKGPNVMQGYFHRPDLTAEVIRDNWFYSGDLGYLDSGGFLFLTGRKKDVIVLSSGKNIYPEEIEEHYSRTPYVKELCVLSRGQEAEGKLESLFAVIVPDLEYFRKVNETNIKDRIRRELEILSSGLPAYKRIMGFTLGKNELPRTRLKKIMRYKVRDEYSRQLSRQDQSSRQEITPQEKMILESPVGRVVAEYFKGVLEKNIRLDDHLEIDLGVDSLSRVEMSAGLSARLRTKIPDTLIYSISTVRQLIAGIEELSKNSASAPTEAQDSSSSWKSILDQMPPQTVLKKIHLKCSWIELAAAFVFKYFLLAFLRLFCNLKISGVKNIPPTGPLIICPNHGSYLDGFVVFCSLPLKIGVKIFYIGHAAIFEHWLAAWAIKLCRLIAIDPTSHLTQALQAAAHVLSNNKIICVFPEGGRSITGEIGEFKKGAGILAKELNVPIVPVHIAGSYQAWPTGRILPRPYPLKITFAKPMAWQELGNNHQEIMANLRKKILDLPSQ